MLLEIDNFEQFKIFFDVIYDITEFIELQLFPDKVRCSILDKGHTRFMSVEYKKEFFALYETDDVESVVLIAEDIHKIIKSASKIDTVILETNEDYLICKLESNNGNTRIFEFVLSADYVESPSPPSISLPVTFNVNMNDLKQGIKDLKIIGSSVIQFTLSNGSLGINAGIEVNTNYSYNINVDVESDETYISRFSSDYIEQLFKFDKISKVVEFKLGQDYPLLYTIKDEIMGVEVKGMIAPRLEVD